MLSTIKILIAGKTVAISGDDCIAEVKAAARWLINNAGAVGSAEFPENRAFEPYNGWPNYETWIAYSWIGSDQETYNSARRIVSRAKSVGRAVDILAEMFKKADPLKDEANIYEDLIRHALDKVDWALIVDHIKNENLED